MWKVIVRREVRPLIDALNGKKTGYPAVYEQLRRDPCAEFATSRGGNRPFAYRLSGVLGTKVCGVHLKRGYRLAFTMRPTDDEHDGIVEILYAGLRDTRNRSRDMWTIVHDLFGEENPPDHHLRPPCCDGGLPAVDEDELAEFMHTLRRFIRGR